MPGDSQRESTKKIIVCNRSARIASNLRFAIFSPPKRGSQKKGAQFGNPEMNRANQAIRANLRIDSSESGHLSYGRTVEGIGVFYVRLVNSTDTKI